MAKTWRQKSMTQGVTVCMNIGQGVGTAAAIAVKDGVEPRNVDVRKVQESLMRQGVEL